MTSSSTKKSFFSRYEYLKYKLYSHQGFSLKLYCLDLRENYVPSDLPYFNQPYKCAPPESNRIAIPPAPHPRHVTTKPMCPEFPLSLTETPKSNQP